MGKNRLVKIISLLMALCAIAVLLPANSFAETIDDRTLYFFKGELRYDSAYGEPATDLSGWSADGDTLTLNGFNYTTSAEKALIIPLETTLILKGTNKIERVLLSEPEPDRGDSHSVLYFTIQANNKLTIKGTGTLNLKCEITGGCGGYSLSANDLYLYESVKVNAVREGTETHLGCTVGAENLKIYDDVVLRVDNYVESVALWIGMIEVAGGTIYATNHEGAGMAVRVGELVFTRPGGVIYAKSNAYEAVSVRDLPSPEIIIKGRSEDSAGDPYTVPGGFLPNLPGSDWLSTGVVDENGAATRRYIKDAIIYMEPVDEEFTQMIHYRDESGKLVAAQELTVKKGDIITNSDLKAPVGYKIRDTVSEQVTDGKMPIDVIVIPFADEEQYKNTDYINGYPDGLFMPKNPITRAEAANIFYKLFAAENYKPNYSVLSRFTDLKSDHWAYDRIAFAVDWNIMQGYPDDTFQPDDTITRAELVTVLYNLNLTPLYENLPPIPFTDISDHWATEIINIMSANGMLDSYGGGRFEPDKDITRAETVALIHKYLQRSDTWEGDKSFADVQPDHWSYEEIMNAANGTH